MSIDIVKQIKTMFSLFTVVPMNVTGDDVEDLSTHFWTIPLIGAFYGLVAGTSFYLLTQIYDGLVSAIIVVLIVHMLNRFLHFDGLIDLGDGMVATGTIEKKVNAMKDTRVGAGGVSYGSSFSILLISSLSSLSWLAFFAPFAAEVLAKNGLLTVAAFGKEREGMGSSFVKNSNEGDVIASTVLSLLLLAIPALLFMPAWLSMGDKVAIVSAALIASVIVGWVMSKVAQRNFGCVNGDLSGGDQ